MEYNKNRYYVIEESTLAQLLRDSFKLGCLEGYGVDNWEGYSEALNYADENDDNSYWNYKEQSDHEIAMEYLKDNSNKLYTLQNYNEWTRNN